MAEQPIFGITNIPQDIKLELNNGTLTLKAGSKVCVPNGVGVFNTITIENDITVTTAGGSNSDITAMLIYDTTSNTVRANVEITRCLSGATEPSNADCWFYNTSTNKIGYWNHSTSTYARTPSSFPLAIVKRSADKKITSIDQVFNGFGYIGSSLFVLPGVEGFYPNGKDGFKNVFTTIKLNRVLIYTSTSAKNNVIGAFSSNIGGYWSSFEVVDKLPELQDMVLSRRYYNKFDNKVYATYDGVNLNVVKDIPWGYFSTGSSSPYRVSSFTIVNPFLKLAFRTVSDYAKYLANLLIIQYNNKPKATQTIESLGGMFPDELILSVRDGFDLETATGSQLDILAKYIGASRGYTDSNSQKAVLTDEEFRVLLMLKTIVNNGNATLAGIENSLYNLFKTGIRVVENKDSGGNQTRSLTYYIRSDWSNVGLAAVQQDILPHPMGISATYNLAAQVKYFGFVEYGDLSHPYSTGFRDYNNPTKQGEMYSYDKVVS